VTLLPEVERALRDAVRRDRGVRAGVISGGGRRWAALSARRLVIAAAVPVAVVAVGVAIAVRGHGRASVVVRSQEVRLVASRAPATTPAGDAARLRAGNARFAGRLLDLLARTRPTVMFSPFSLSEALAMTSAGARRQTATQIAAALDFGLPPARLHAAFNAADQALRAASGPGTSLDIANALYGQQGMSFHHAFLGVLARDYGAGMRIVNFAGATEAARGAINHWVSTQTHGKIPQLLAPGEVDQLTRLVLTNAVYLHATWRSPFSKQNTGPAPFHAPNGTISVPTMHQTAVLEYRRGAGYQALELPYRGGRLAFDILLPDHGQLPSLLGRLTTVGPLALIGGLASRDVTVALPKLKLRTGLQLADALAALGMPRAFIPGQADLSGIAGPPGALYIKQVVHQADLNVDEQGTTAAAATGVVVNITAAQAAIPFGVDRPFVFVLRDIKTGAILFTGTVSRP
jgi:serpin B